MPSRFTRGALRASLKQEDVALDRRLPEVAAKQAEELAFFPIWSYAHPQAIALAERLARRVAERFPA